LLIAEPITDFRVNKAGASLKDCDVLPKHFHKANDPERING
jgi:hypothetical protein